jgi:hypothetical protein
MYRNIRGGVFTVELRAPPRAMPLAIESRLGADPSLLCGDCIEQKQDRLEVPFLQRADDDSGCA